MKKYVQIYLLLIMFAFCASCKGANKVALPKNLIESQTEQVTTSHGPEEITRNIIQDRKGSIWIAAFDGIFRYDGKSFINMTHKVSLVHFFSVLEDRKGNLWFGSVGSGVYCYDGKKFRNFTIKDGLSGNEVTCIYEDKSGNIWFGTQSGLSCYNGKSFRNFTIKEGSPNNEINAIIQDKTGRFWFGTKGNTYFYDGKTFTAFTHDGKPFTNVRTMINDKKSNLLLGGQNGLWRYDGKAFANLTPNFIGYICEDRSGNLWISSASADNLYWALSRYDENSLYNKETAATKITLNKGMICGILEAKDGNIWFGAMDGAYRYDGKTVIRFSGKKEHPLNGFNSRTL